LSQVGQEREGVKLELRVNEAAMRSSRIAGVLPALKRNILPYPSPLKKAQGRERVVPMHVTEKVNIENESGSVK